MEIIQTEVRDAIEVAAHPFQEVSTALTDLQLALVGGGCGETVFD